MADTQQTAGTAADPGLGGLMRRIGLGNTGDLLMPFGVIAILAVLVFPLPTWLLDISLEIGRAHV